MQLELTVEQLMKIMKRRPYVPSPSGGEEQMHLERPQAHVINRGAHVHPIIWWGCSPPDQEKKGHEGESAGPAEVELTACLGSGEGKTPVEAEWIGWCRERKDGYLIGTG